MADTKITALGAQTGAAVASGDLFVSVDVSDTSMDAGGTDKKLTFAEFLNALATGDLVVSGGALILSGTANVETVIRTNTIDQLAPAAANVDFNTHKAINVADATTGTDGLNRQAADARFQPLDADLTALAQGAGWLLDSNTWTVHVVPTQASMTTIVAASTVGHASLTYTNGDAVIATGFANTTGITNGSMYYIVGQTSTTVQLALAPGGSAITFGGTADTTAVTLTGVNQFTVAVDATGYLTPGVKASYNDGGVDYGVVATAKNNSGTTTVTLIPNNDYSIANAALTAPRFSYFETPVGFPASFACAMLLTGTADPSVRTYRWRTIARQLTLMCFHFNTGTSSSTTHTLSLPVAAGTASAAFNSFLATTDSGTAGLGYATVSSSSNFATLNGKSTGSNTASGGSGINGQIVYEF